MSFEILHRYTRALLYRSETANTVRETVAQANLSGADLSRANLYGANLSGADLYGANLYGADLSGANLSGADLSGANLSGADLSRADLSGADLSGANLSGADLSGADLYGANLSRANLSGADLSGANLSAIKVDFYKVLNCAKDEVPALLAALQAGKVDGSSYTGSCACLVGTIANARNCSYQAIDGLAPDSNRPAERFFLAIQQGDTPSNNQSAKIAEGWITEWQAVQA